MVHRGFRPFSAFPVVVFLTVQCVPLVTVCVRELGVAGYTKFVRIDCGELRCEFGLLLYHPGYFNVVRDGSCVSCVPASSCARSHSRSSSSRLWSLSMFVTFRSFGLVIVICYLSVTSTFILSIAK